MLEFALYFLWGILLDLYNPVKLKRRRFILITEDNKR